MKKSVKILIGVAVLAVAVGAVGFGVYNYNQNANSSGVPRGALPVELQEAHTETIKTQISAKGIVELDEIFTVYPSTQAEISEVLVKKGDVITEGQLLVRYSSDGLDTLNDQLSEAKLALSSAELSLQAAQLPVVSQMEISQADASIRTAESMVTDIEEQVKQLDLNLSQLDSNISIAEKKYDNTKLLYDRGALPQRDLDSAYEALKQLRDQRQVLEAQRNATLLSIKSAQDKVDTAKETYNLTLARQTDEAVANKIALQRLQVEQAKLRIKQIENQIDKFEPEEFSPYSGTILELTAMTGDMAVSSKPLLTVAELGIDNLKLNVDVPESDAVDLETGQSVEIRGNALGQEVFTGKVGKISPTAQEKMIGNTRMTVLTVEIVPDSGANLRAGYTIESTIITRVAENAVVVPLMSTLSDENGNDYVFLMRSDFSVEKRIIELGDYTGMYIEATSGIEVGEKIVLNPSSQIKDGDFVRPIIALGQ